MGLNWQEVDAIALAAGCLAASTEPRKWQVGDKTAAWQRPLSKKDLAALGADAPTGEVLAVHVADVGVKTDWVSSHAECFDSPHFSGYPAVLVDLSKAKASTLEALFADAIDDAR